MIPKSDLFEIYCKVLINSFNIMDDDYLPVGIGLYLEASVLDHDCWPNATVVFSGKEAHVRAVAEVGSFDRVRISYTRLYFCAIFLWFFRPVLPFGDLLFIHASTNARDDHK